MTLARPSFLDARPALCACSHGLDSHHPAGRCMADLPPDEGTETPAWSCPCRRFVASAVTTRLLATVQSCTVLAPRRAPDLLELAAEALAELKARELGLVRRPPP